MKKPLPLPDNEIHLWITRPDAITHPDWLDQYANLLNHEETARQHRFRFEKDRHSFLITRAFVRDLLSQYVAIAPGNWCFRKGEKDKPEIANSGMPIQLRFNLSHTQGMIACAVCTDSDIGCDVEYMPRDNDILAIANRYFSPFETRELFSLPANQQRSRFFDYWTLKESYIKAWGLGLAIPLTDFTFHISPGDSPINSDIHLSFAPHRIDYPELWQSWLLYPNANHRMAISIRESHKKTRSIRLFQSTPCVEFHEIHLPIP